MKSGTKWFVLFLLLILVGGGIITSGLLIWNRSQKEKGIPLDREKTAQLKKQLDENLRSIFIFDPDTSYRLKPSFQGLRHNSSSLPHSTNSRGILGGEEINPDPSVRKILFLGDSVTYGEEVPYEDVFVSRMAVEAGDSFQLLNAGCPGWSTHQELTAYRKYFADLPIDTVVIVFALNDLLRFEWVWRDDNSFQMSAELRGLGGLAHSKLTARALKKIRGRFWNNLELRPLANLNNTCLNSYLLPKWIEWLNRIQPAISEIVENKHLIIVAVPARPQLETLNLGGDPDTVLLPQRQLEKFCSENGIEYVNLVEAFKEESGGYEIDFFLRGGVGLLHLSPDGHERVAGFLFPIIFPEE
ncbi:MAG: SGNH/GDSL hydrolase family protein [Candidatus Auribacterota bacterium]|nr:SGNH/GDSL hydrolase family protein [Candidatus Auribacterota bacterium]